jgi:hypothetical protein
MRAATEKAVAAILERYPDDPYATHLTEELWKILEIQERYEAAKCPTQHGMATQTYSTIPGVQWPIPYNTAFCMDCGAKLN